MGARYIAYSFSILMIIGTIFLLATKGLNFGIDFRGGILMEIRTEKPADISTKRQTLNQLGLGDVTLQEFGSPHDLMVYLPQQEGGKEGMEKATTMVRDALAEYNAEFRRVEFVGPKVGNELIRDGVLAVILSIVGIVGYIWLRFEWQFSMGAIIALAHDVITTLGLFAIMGKEFNLTTLAAVLTIAGYSINDTVVIYDRIRENLRKYKSMPLGEMLNLSLNQTLSRTTVTALTTLLAVAALYIWGGEVISGFSLALLWGIVIGTYSSLFIATPFLLTTNLRDE